MLNIILDTHKAISAAKTKKNMGKTMLVLLVASVLAGLAATLVAKDAAFLLPALGVVAFFFISTLVMAFFVKLALVLLTKKGGYYEALTAMSYGFFAMAVGGFIASLLNLLSGYNVVLTVIVSVLAGLVMFAAVVLGKVIKVRTAMDLFGTDLITVVFSCIIVYIGMFFALYAGIMGTMFAVLGTLDPSAFGTGAGMPGGGFEGVDLSGFEGMGLY
ncbi:hypothetical protein KKA95_02885 [Patescibacteria group bacterium]|nr:hypothetical protein [Patescibacteria group bacterium]